jgi:hypothetical protein
MVTASSTAPLAAAFRFRSAGVGRRFWPVLTMVARMVMAASGFAHKYRPPEHAQ